MKTANLAIVFTDIKGFTERTSRQTLEENQRLLQVHQALLAPLFKAFGGRIVKSIGDAFLVTFESPTQAVLSGIAIQDRLWQHNRGLSDSEQLHVRVAVNVGEVRLEANDVFGEPVNIAARVEGITEAGEVFFTEAVYLAMNKAEVPSQEVGAFELKGIPGKIRVFRVPRAPYRVEAPSPGAVVPADAEASMPPYGNLALSRVSESALSGAVDLGALGQRAAVLGQRAADGAVVLGRQARTASGVLMSRLSQVLPPTLVARLQLQGNGRKVALGAGGVALALGLAVVAWGGGATMRAIHSVEGTSGAEKETRVREARRLIGDERDVGRRHYLFGQLEEAQGNVKSSLDSYERAARAGDRTSESRIIALLDHAQCGVRAAAASAVADLKLKRARGALEDLADDGGSDDGQTGGLFGLGTCDSKKAAQNALRRMGED
ncbi:adenylate/guanylate cyclase domain-containing protein [Myxococcaceae bacterium JPH2]|nr:adenylate/guanylate cyclase domain-containing protein [Myxococcaceae bacterium JPH2]